MIEMLIDFLQKKEKQNGGIVLSNHIVFGSIGGSHLYNTQGVGSDFDLRAVTVLSEDYILGLNRFEHTKLNGGIDNITTAGDVDAEVFHYDSFIKRVINGETNCVEMLYAPPSKQYYIAPIFKRVIENKDIFLSKNLIRHYKGLIFSHLNQAAAKLENVKKPEKRERIEKYSYETKDMMKAILYLKLCIEFLEEGVLNYHREDRAELLSIKEGAFSTYAEAKAYADELVQKRNQLFETSLLPNHPDNQKMNEFMKSYNRDILSYIGVTDEPYVW